MPNKDPEIQKRLQREWYLRRKADPVAYAARIQAQRDYRAERPTYNVRKIAKVQTEALMAESARLIAEARDRGCLLCSEREHCALDFHHVDPSTKSFGIARRHLKRNASAIREEIAKCVVLCKNCHAKLHAGLVCLPVE